jgi:hypothetical protein
VTRRSVSTASMIDQIGKAIAALKPFARPTEAMIDEAVWLDAFWAINGRADFEKAVRAMIRGAAES